MIKQNKVNIIPIFDGKPPEQKKDEIDDRKEKRAKIKDKIKSLKTCVQKYCENIDFTTEEIDLVKDTLKKIDDKGSSTKLKKLLSFSKLSVKDEEKEEFKLDDKDIEDINIHIIGLERQMVYIGEKDTVLLKDLLSILGVPFTISPSEAEGYCCYLIKQGLGSAIISCDTDCFAHGATEVVLSLDAQTGMIEYINLQELLEEMELTQDQFIDFGILIGCDYNKKNKLPKVGPVKALELIKKYKSIDNIEGYDISTLNHKEIRELFKMEYPLMKKIKQKEIDEDQLFQFIDEHNLKIGAQRVREFVKSISNKSNIVFIDDL